MRLILCTTHPSSPAGWRCTVCGRDLCPDCTGFRVAGQGRVELCMPCGSLAHRLRAHRSEHAPLSTTLLSSLRWPSSREGLISLAAVSVIVHLLQLSGGLGGLIGFGVMLAYLFQIVRHTAAGHDDVPAPEDFHNIFDDVIGPSFRALLASMWFLAPPMIWIYENAHSLRDVLAFDEIVPITPLPVALMLLGALLYPMSIIIGALRGPMYAMLNPIAVIGGALRLGSDYWRCSLFCLACSFGGGLVSAGCDALFDRVPIPFSGFLGAAISLYLPFVSFRALGLLVRARGDELGYGGGDAYRVAILDASPRHEVKPVEIASGSAHERLYAPIELGPMMHPMEIQAVAESAAELGTPTPQLEFEEERKAAPGAVALPETVDAQLPSRLAMSMATRDLDNARALLRAGGASIPASTLSAQSWSELARSMGEEAARTSPDEKRARAELSLLACMRAIELAPQGALAPKIWLQAARLCDELLSNRTRSDRLLRELVQRFPETDEGKFAARRLAAAPK